MLLRIQVTTWPWSPTLVNIPKSGITGLHGKHRSIFQAIYPYLHLHHLYVYVKVYVYMFCGTATLFSIVVAPFYALTGRVEGLKFP